jgi:hypothetical protein
MGTPSRPRFDRLEPTCPDYARLPVGEAFSWADCSRAADAGEWYLVAFRSVLREGADQDRLREYDDLAHADAQLAPGFVHYFKGPANDRGECLSFCLWTSRGHARAAAGRPAHREAVTIAHGTYEQHTLEFLRLIKRAGAAEFDFQPFDLPSAASGTPSAPADRPIRRAAWPAGAGPAARPRVRLPAGPAAPARTRRRLTAGARTRRP